MLQLVDKSFSGARAPAPRNSGTTSHAPAQPVAAHTDATSDADGVWDTVEGDVMEDYLVHETGGGVDDLEMDDTED